MWELIALVAVDSIIILLLVLKVNSLRDLLKQSTAGYKRAIKATITAQDSYQVLEKAASDLIEQNRRLLGYGLREASKNVKHMDTSLGS